MASGNFDTFAKAVSGTLVIPKGLAGIWLADVATNANMKSSLKHPSKAREEYHQTSSRTIPFPSSHVRRTASEIQLSQDLRGAAYADLGMFSRIFAGVGHNEELRHHVPASMTTTNKEGCDMHHVDSSQEEKDLPAKEENEQSCLSNQAATAVTPSYCKTSSDSFDDTSSRNSSSSFICHSKSTRRPADPSQRHDNLHRNSLPHSNGLSNGGDWSITGFKEAEDAADLITAADPSPSCYCCCCSCVGRDDSRPRRPAADADHRPAVRTSEQQYPADEGVVFILDL